MHELSPMPFMGQIIGGVVLWLALAMLIIFHKYGAKIVGVLFFITGMVCMIVKPTSQAIWVLLLSGLFFYVYGMFKKNLSNSKNASEEPDTNPNVSMR